MAPTRVKPFALVQELLPAPPSPARRQLLKAQQQTAPEKPWVPDQKLCAVLSDMREARQKQLDVAETLRGGVPRKWWGAQTGSGQHKLGSRLQIIQVLSFIGLMPRLLLYSLSNAEIMQLLWLPGALIDT